jgi:cellulose synthase/poly-beta-1,6-N-acetylglucosamine synthase-like glycosyltransferase
MIESILFVFFILATLFQTLVWWLIINPLWKKNSLKKSQSAPAPLPELSIIICARNEATQLKLQLPTVLEQVYPTPWELIVVNDASTDNSAQVLAAYQKQYPQLQVIHIAEKQSPGKKKALEIGILASKYPVILLCDADCRPASTLWAQKMCAELTHSDTALVLGYSPNTPGKGYWNCWLQFETGFTALQYLSMAMAGMPYMGVGRNMAFKKSLFLQHGAQLPHPELASGDDDLFVNKVANAQNTRCCLDPDARVFSSGKETFFAWLEQKNRHISTSVHYHWLHQGILGAFHLSMIIHYGLGAMLLLIGKWPLLIGAAYLFRIIPVVKTYQRIYQTLKIPIHWLLFPLLDGCMALFEGLYLPYALWWKKTIHWK